MRGADTFTEGLFTLKKLDDFAPANHPQRVIRTMVNTELAEMGDLFAQMYEDFIKAGAPALLHRSCCGPCCYRCCTPSARSVS